MKLQITFTIASLFISLISNGQNELSKLEIFKSWTQNVLLQKQGFNNIKDIEFKRGVEEKATELIYHFQNTYDTLAFYFISNEDIIDSCTLEPSSFVLYLFWQESGKTFATKMTANCIFPKIEIKKLEMFDFYMAHNVVINTEFIMPVILGARGEKGKIVYKLMTISHDKSHILFCKLGKLNKTLEFSEFDISCKEGLFYQDNIESKAYKWFSLIKKDIQKLW